MTHPLSLSFLDSDVVFADKFKLDEVLRNLISNALKFSARDSMISVRVGFAPAMVSSEKPNSMRRSDSARNVIQGLRSMLNNSQNKVMDESQSILKVGSGSVRGSFALENKSETIAPAITRVLAPDKTRRHSLRAFMAPFLGSLTSLSRSNNKINPEIKIASPNDDIMGSLIVVVTDIGTGISKENQQLIFQEGMQFDPEKLQTGGGSGFGEYYFQHSLSLTPLS